MAEEIHTAPGSEQDPALPRSHVLGYLTSSATPTRVRSVTAGVLVILGYLTLVASLFLGAMWVIAYPDLIAELFRMFHWSRGTRFIFRYAFPRLYVPLLLCPSLFVAALVMVSSARFVRRGQRLACLMAAAAMLVVILSVLFAAAKIGAFAVFNGLGFGWRGVAGEAADPAQLWWLLVTFALAPVVALLVDVINYLLWIFRNPVTEKPAAPFLPRSSKRS
jgi:hypothetical protein